MKYSKSFHQEILSWPEVSTHPHRFGGTEFRYKTAEIGHMHAGGTLDIPFPRSIRDALLSDGFAQEHHWVPNSGWITFQVRSEQDVQHAVWLMRLSYLRYALKTTHDPHGLLNKNAEEMRLSPHYQALLETLIPKPAAA